MFSKYFFNKVEKIIDNRDYDFKELCKVVLLCIVFEVFMVALALDKSEYFEKFLLNNNYNLLIIIYDILLLIPPLFLVAYIIVFLYKKFWVDIILSNRCNIVVSLNFSGLNNTERYLKKYNIFLNNLNNSICQYDLINVIKIIKSPKDIKWDNNKAEGKTKLGKLFGATLIVWGRAYKKNNDIKFETKFSYEFGYPPKIFKEKKAIEIINNYIEKIINSGLFNPRRLSINFNKGDLDDDILLTCLFILGFTIKSFGNFEKSLKFFNEFKNRYNALDLMRRKELGPTIIEIDKSLIDIHIRLLERIFDLNKKENLIKIKDSCEEILKIDPKNYNAYLFMSFYYYKSGNLIDAKSINELARENAPFDCHNHTFNSAFFSLVEKKYEDAIMIYESIPDITNVNIAQIKDFFNCEYNLSRNPIFLFAEGYVVWRWGDNKNYGKKILKKFISDTSDIKKCDEYEKLIIKARELI